MSSRGKTILSPRMPLSIYLFIGILFSIIFLLKSVLKSDLFNDLSKGIKLMGKKSLVETDFCGYVFVKNLHNLGQ